MRKLENLLFGLGIRFVGRTVARDLAHSLKSLDAIMNADEETLLAIDSIGPKIAESVVTFFKLPRNMELIQQLRDAGLNFEMEKEKLHSSDLQGKRIVITGTLPTLSRNEAKALIESNGGKTTSSVSKNTDYILVGESAGSKLAKAESLGVPVITEADLRDMIGDE